MRLPAPEQLWHERLRRALKRERFSQAQREFASDLLVLRAQCPRFLRVDGRCTWPLNAAAGDDDATDRATAGLLDRMGVRLGIGPCPGSPDDAAA